MKNKKELLGNSLQESLASAGPPPQVYEEKKASFLIQTRWLEMIGRESYWDDRLYSEVVNSALEKYFADKALKPIPEEARRLIERRKRK